MCLSVFTCDALSHGLLFWKLPRSSDTTDCNLPGSFWAPLHSPAPCVVFLFLSAATERPRSRWAPRTANGPQPRNRAADGVARHGDASHPQARGRQERRGGKEESAHGVQVGLPHTGLSTDASQAAWNSVCLMLWIILPAARDELTPCDPNMHAELPVYCNLKLRMSLCVCVCVLFMSVRALW